MNVLIVANVAAVIVAVWAFWECRITAFRSRWDSPKTIALLLFALAAALDSPLREVAAASFPLTGRYYAATVIGHICYLTAAASGVKYIYLRLLPDSAIGPFVRTRMLPLIVAAAGLMVFSFSMSPRTATLTADHLYVIRPDGWLVVYWLTFYGALSALLLAAMYGVNRLRSDPRSVMLILLITSLVLGELSVLVSALGLVTGRSEAYRSVAWPITYAAIAVGAVAVVIAWRHRVWQLIRPSDPGGASPPGQASSQSDD